jgi:hypothetical protein
MILSFNYRGNSNYSEFSEKILAVGYTGTVTFFLYATSVVQPDPAGSEIICK